eukprot:TRINITY_DN54651_c0_g1_i1.p1 TRINITY_DN54651_c0_g1~~TRINITY_DN54651_c0_g1_i1.p1  ORF type:complete len:438 (+),score=83.32 TRINITY_DN54651_c0_g1_i1:175-1314(+)
MPTELRAGSPALSQARFFGASVKKRSPRRQKGIVGKALRASPPPRLQAKALQSYVSTLRRDGGEAARLIVKASKLDGQEKPLVALTSEEKTALVARYLPDEQESITKFRMRSHKWLWRFIRQRAWRKHDACMEAMKKQRVNFDEVTYNLAIFSALLHPQRQDELARQLVNEMAASGKFHPALLRLHRGFAESYFELREVDATPTRDNLLRLAKTFWHISVKFKRRRVREIRQKLAEASARQRQRLASEQAAVEAAEEREQLLAVRGNLVGATPGVAFASDDSFGRASRQSTIAPTSNGGSDANVSALALEEGESEDYEDWDEEDDLPSGSDYEDGDDVLGGGLGLPPRDPKAAYRRPRQLKGAFKGSGAKNRRLRRWRQ